MAAKPKKRRGPKPKKPGRKRQARGTRGPAPEPTAQVKRRGGRPRNPDRTEPEPDRYEAPPPAPAVLEHPWAVHAWEELAPQLHNSGVLTRADAPTVLARYCITWAVWRECAAFVQRWGTAFPMRRPGRAPDRPGDLVGFRSYPQARFLSQYANTLVTLERELGLTPSARARLDVDLPGTKDPAAGGDPLFAAG